MPAKPSVSKEVDRLDEHCQTFIAHSTFMVMATGGCDVSPKGERPGIALLFCVPGLDETLRVNGVATITTDPDVITAFLHCGKALRRGAVWLPEEWPDTSGMPSVACMLRDPDGLPGMDVEAVQARLDASYRDRMWSAGGTPTTWTGARSTPRLPPAGFSFEYLDVPLRRTGQVLEARPVPSGRTSPRRAVTT